MTSSSAAENTKGLIVSALRKRMPGFELRADFAVGPSQRAALLGKSGSGKTTLLRIVAGLESLDEGRIELDGQAISDLPAQRRHIGLMFQDYALFPALSVAENIAFGLRVRGAGTSERRAQAEEWLAKVGLAGRGDSRVGELSGGERQRVAFARAVIWKPRLILCDEPFSALDATLRATMRQELVDLHRLWPVPLLFVTHDPADIEAVATQRLEIRETSEGIREIARH